MRLHRHALPRRQATGLLAYRGRQFDQPDIEQHRAGRDVEQQVRLELQEAREYGGPDGRRYRAIVFLGVALVDEGQPAQRVRVAHDADRERFDDAAAVRGAHRLAGAQRGDQLAVSPARFVEGLDRPPRLALEPGRLAVFVHRSTPAEHREQTDAATLERRGRVGRVGQCRITLGLDPAPAGHRCTDEVRVDEHRIAVACQRIDLLGRGDLETLERERRLVPRAIELRHVHAHLQALRRHRDELLFITLLHMSLATRAWHHSLCTCRISTNVSVYANASHPNETQRPFRRPEPAAG